MTPIVTLPKPDIPATGLCGYCFPMQERQAPFGMIIFTVAKGAYTQAHQHLVHEYWLIIAGQGELIYDGEPYHVKEGDLLYFESEKSHQIFNHSDELLKIISLDWHGGKLESYHDTTE